MAEHLSPEGVRAMRVERGGLGEVIAHSKEEIGKIQEDGGHPRPARGCAARPQGLIAESSLFESVLPRKTRRNVLSAFEEMPRTLGGGACGFIGCHAPREFHASEWEDLSPFCKCVRWNDVGADSCWDCDTWHASMVRDAGSAVYTCHAGLIDYQLPLYDKHGHAIGTFVGGQFAPPHIDFLHVMALGSSLRMDFKRWFSLLGDVPLLTLDVAGAICELLRTQLGRFRGLDEVKLASQIEQLHRLLVRHADPDRSMYDLVARQWLHWQRIAMPEEAGVWMNVGVLAFGRNGSRDAGSVSPVGWYSKRFGSAVSRAAVSFDGGGLQRQISALTASGMVASGSGRVRAILSSDLIELNSRWDESRAMGRQASRYCRVIVGSSDSAGVYDVSCDGSDDEPERMETRDRFLCKAAETLEKSVNLATEAIRQVCIPAYTNDLRDTIWAAGKAIELGHNEEARRQHLRSIIQRMCQFLSRPSAHEKSLAEAAAQLAGRCGLAACTIDQVLSGPGLPEDRIQGIGTALAKTAEVFNRWPDLVDQTAVNQAFKALYQNISDI